jgi:O-antigen/teichoic acid export membrane protein
LGGVLAGWDVPRIVGGLLVARVLLLAVHIVACLRVFPLLARPTWGDRERLGPLFTFGGWMTVSALAGLALGYADRFAIGHALSMTALTYYSVPQDLIGRLGLIAATLASVLVPAFSTLGGAQDLSRLSLLFSRSAKLVALIMGPAFIILAVFSQNILTLWLGPALASQSAPVLRVLALGAGFQVLTVIPTSMVQAVGRPDLVAKFYLIEAPLYLAAVWWLVHTKGIGGVAVAWSGRFALDGLLMFWATLRMGLWSWDSSTTRVVGALVGVSVCTALVYVMPLTLWTRAGLAAGLIVVFYRIVWTSILLRDERQWIFQMASQWRGEPVSPQG